MKLSQDRTRSVLDFSYFNTKIPDIHRKWLKSRFAAVGLSSSKLKCINEKTNPETNECVQEDKERSRRVTFRIITNADKELNKILSEFQ